MKVHLALIDVVSVKKKKKSISFEEAGVYCNYSIVYLRQLIFPVVISGNSIYQAT